MLELRDAQLQVVPLLARHEAELSCKILDATARSLAHSDGVAAPARRELLAERAQLVEPRAEDRDQALERVAFVSGLCHAGASSAAAAATRVWRLRRRRSQPRRHRSALPAPAPPRPPAP